MKLFHKKALEDMKDISTNIIIKLDSSKHNLLKEIENYALPLNVAIVTIADFIASEEDMTEDDRKTAAIVLYMIAQKLENSGDSEIEPRLQH